MPAWAFNGTGFTQATQQVGAEHAARAARAALWRGAGWAAGLEGSRSGAAHALRAGPVSPPAGTGPRGQPLGMGLHLPAGPSRHHPACKVSPPGLGVHGRDPEKPGTGLPVRHARAAAPLTCVACSAPSPPQLGALHARRFRRAQAAAGQPGLGRPSGAARPPLFGPDRGQPGRGVAQRPAGQRHQLQVPGQGLLLWWVFYGGRACPPLAVHPGGRAIPSLACTRGFAQSAALAAAAPSNLLPPRCTLQAS